MRINSLELRAFGKFIDKTITLADGFNVIYGENGAGKTTVIDFIRLMFYGSCGSERSRDISKNPRKKYLPRSGAPMSGSVTFEHKAHRYLLSRAFGKTPAADNITLFDITDGTDIPVSPADNLGLRFWGMELDEFERTIFVNDPAAFTSDYTGSGLAAKISNLSISGNENISEETVLKRISAAKEALVSKSGKKGVLVELKSELCALRSEYDSAIAELDRQSEITEELSRILTEIAELERDSERRGSAQKAEAMRRELKTYEYIDEKYQAAENALKPFYDLGIISPPDRITTETLQHAADTLKPRLSECRLTASRLGITEDSEEQYTNTEIHPVLYVLAAFFAVLSCLALWARLRLGQTAFSLISAAALFACLLTVLCIVLRRNTHNISSDTNAQLCREVGELFGEKITDTRTALEKLDAMSAAFDNADSALRDITAAACASGISDFGRDTIRAKSAEIRNISDAFPSFEPCVPAPSQLVSELSEKRRRADELRLKFTPSRLDIHAAEAEISECERRIREYENRYKSLCTAESVMQEAAYETRRGLSTRLSIKTAEYLKAMSDSCAENVAVSNSLNIHVLPFGDSEYRSHLGLSVGQSERIYMALRLAAADIATLGHGAVPLLLDDAFAHYDDTSRRNTLSFLGTLAESSDSVSQILFFTCHGETALDTAELVPNSVKIEL